jgi:DNA-binding GntR family transcriptional regulator
MSEALAHKSAAPRSLGDQAYEGIREDIIACRLAPGAEITEARLAVRLGVGKAPVRTALVRLAQEGLVQTLPRRGYRVAPITIRDVQELFALRLMLEPQAAQAAAGRIDAERLRRFDAVCRAGYQPGDRDSERAFLKANCDFHMAIVRASGNRRLTALVQNLMDDMERLLHVGLALRNRSQEIQHEHASLVDALATGDGAAAARITAQQIEDARRMVMEGLMSSPALLEVPVTFEPVEEDAS